MMSKSKHTPGPWKFRTAAFNGDNGISAYETGVFVEAFADIRYAGENNREEALANARLIAASPDLLQKGKHLAVKLAEVYRAAGQNPKNCQAIREWMEVAARAEGGDA
jgi:hypothetical protein